MTTIIKTASGRTRTVPDHLENLDTITIVGLDEDGRIVVQLGWMAGGQEPYAFGLTLCCDAWDKGLEDGVYCRACYGAKPNADAGNYLFMSDDGSWPGLDPVVSVE